MIFRILFLVLCAIGMAACAHDETVKNDADGDEVSTIPWNRPERWEGQGALGGFSPRQEGYR
jgi:hypothetical protein